MVNCTAVGVNALNLCNTIGTGNTAVGLNASAKNTYGVGNTSLGVDAMYENETGNYNVSIGYESLFYSNKTPLSGYDNINTLNVSVGFQAMYNNASGVENTSIGSESLHTSTNASYNTAIGYGSGYYAASGGDTNTYLGYNSGPASGSPAYSNSTAIGANAEITASNQVVIGTSADTVKIPGTFHVEKPSFVEITTVTNYFTPNTLPSGTFIYSTYVGTNGMFLPDANTVPIGYTLILGNPTTSLFNVEASNGYDLIEAGYGVTTARALNAYECITVRSINSNWLVTSFH